MNNLQKFFEEIYYESNSLKTIQKLELILDKIENVSSHLNEASTWNRTIVDDYETLSEMLAKMAELASLLSRQTIVIQKQNRFDEIEDLLIKIFRHFRRILYRENITNNNQYLNIFTQSLKDTGAYITRIRHYLQNNNLLGVITHRNGTPTDLTSLTITYYLQMYQLHTRIKELNIELNRSLD